MSAEHRTDVVVLIGQKYPSATAPAVPAPTTIVSTAAGKRIVMLTADPPPPRRRLLSVVIGFLSASGNEQPEAQFGRVEIEDVVVALGPPARGEVGT
jgi:hypothetical protein